MSRRFLDDVRADINAGIIANGAGLITADVLRPMLIDTIDSSIDDEATIGSSTDIIALAVNDTTWTVIECDEFIGGDAQFLNVDLANNQMVSSPTAGYTYSCIALANLESGATKRYELAVLVNGTPTGYIGDITTRGVNKPVNDEASALVLSAVASAKFQIGIRSIDDVSDTLNIRGHVLQLVIKPTNNP